jgi:protein required for attachment to host cells
MLVQWVMVADAAHAQIYKTDLMFTELEPVDSRIHPQSRVKAKELVAGDRGSNRAYAGAVHSAYERHTDPHRGAQDAFAKELGEWLGVGRQEQRYERLVLIAPPAFLGRLRAQLDAETERAVVGTLAHDWVEVAPRELAQRLRRHFSAA